MGPGCVWAVTGDPVSSRAVASTLKRARNRALKVRS